ncbi:MAG: glycosyltransferase [Peptococcaceae bacterium]|nr:glycosyltransferase [Peptococcaceae bacterium]
MKVLHLIGGGEIGGAEHHIITLLPGLQARGVQPLLGCLYTHSPLAEKIQAETSIPTDLFPMRAPIDLTPLPRLLKFCARHQITLIHCHGLRANILGRIATLFSRLPSITTWHSWPKSDFPGILTGKIAMSLEGLTFGLSAGSIMVSHALTKQLEDWPPLHRRLPSSQKLNKKKNNGKKKNPQKEYPYQTIYNSYAPLAALQNPSLTHEARRYYRSLWHIPEDAWVLGSVGRLHPVKGHRYLLDAAARLADHHPKIHLLLIGEGPERPTLEQHLSGAAYTHTLAGYLPDAQRALPAMDTFVFPSLHEGLGIALLEAIHAQLPIVATAVGGIPEVLRAGADALLVPPANSSALASACQRLLEDSQLRQDLTASAQKRLIHFSPEHMADQTVEFYHRVVSASAPQNKSHRLPTGIQ